MPLSEHEVVVFSLEAHLSVARFRAACTHKAILGVPNEGWYFEVAAGLTGKSSSTGLLNLCPQQYCMRTGVPRDCLNLGFSTWIKDGEADPTERRTDVECKH